MTSFFFPPFPLQSRVQKPNVYFSLLAHSYDTLIHLPYLAMLPSPDKLRMPLHFTTAELDVLRSTYLHGTTLNHRSALGNRVGAVPHGRLCCLRRVGRGTHLVRAFCVKNMSYPYTSDGWKTRNPRCPLEHGNPPESCARARKSPTPESPGMVFCRYRSRRPKNTPGPPAMNTGCADVWSPQTVVQVELPLGLR